MVKNLPANAGDARDTSSIPESGRSPGVGNGNLLQYSGLENPEYRGASRATLQGLARGRTRLSDWVCAHTAGSERPALQELLLLVSSLRYHSPMKSLGVLPITPSLPLMVHHLLGWVWSILMQVFWLGQVGHKGQTFLLWPLGLLLETEFITNGFHWGSFGGGGFPEVGLFLFGWLYILAIQVNLLQKHSLY